MQIDLSIFKDYDIRGVYPTQLNRDVVRAIGFAIVRKFAPKTVAIGRDMRLSGAELQDGLASAFTSAGVNVYNLGLIGTEIAYFVAGSRPYDMTIMISASHNPAQYNGLKIVLKGPVAITADNGLGEIRDLISQEPVPTGMSTGKLTQIDVTNEWKQKIQSLVDIGSFRPFKIVVDAGNGMAGTLVPKVFEGLPFNVTPLFMELDGTFPHHVPNPLIESNNKELIQKVVTQHASVGLTFDGDADRMFLIDDKGRFVSGTITTALLARYILTKHPGELILYNAICGRIVPETIKKFGGKSKRVRVGHSYIKTYMKETGAIFAGEHSGHYYWRDFFAAESGALTALMVLSLLSAEKRKLSELVDELNVYPASGEINFTLGDIPLALDAIRFGFTDAISKDEVDGISVWYKNYWFNVRASKTEPLLRLNLEADTEDILHEKLHAVIDTIEKLGGKRKE